MVALKQECLEKTAVGEMILNSPSWERAYGARSKAPSKQERNAKKRGK